MKYAIYLGAVGRPSDAVTHMQRAIQLDPLSFFMNRRLGATLYLARNYPAAIAQLQRAAEMEPDQHSVVDSWMSVAYEMSGQHNQAVDHDLIFLQPILPATAIDNLRSIYKLQDWDAYWRARLDQLLLHDTRPCSSYEIALNYIRVRDTDHAFASLNATIDSGCYQVVWFKAEPLLDSIRPDPRYLALLQRVNLSPH
jgi:tetratricopeptide (TPR) repeat protein